MEVKFLKAMLQQQSTGRDGRKKKAVPRDK